MRNCPMSGKAKLKEFASLETSANWDTTISKDEKNKTVHSTKKRSTIDHHSMFSSSTFRTQSVYWWKSSGKKEVINKTITEEVILSPSLWSKILKRKSAAENLKSLVLEILKKQSEEINTGKNGYNYRVEIRTDTATTPYGNREIRSTKNADLDKTEKPFDATTISTNYTKTITINLSSSPYEEVNSLTKEPEVDIMKTAEHVKITTNNGDNEKFRQSINQLNLKITKSTTSLIEPKGAIDQQTTITHKDLGGFSKKKKKRMKISHFSNLSKNQI